MISFFSNAQADQAPSISADGRQVFCIGSSTKIVTDFTITDADDTTIASFFIQISSGYQFNFDRLELSGSHPNIIPVWNANDGKLTLISVVSGGEILLTDLENAVKDIVFTTTSSSIIKEKTFSLSIDDANYLPSTDHFYQFITAQNISWSDAKVAAENQTYYGRKGYLATLTSKEEANFAGKQVSGAGWIGGSDEETEGVWKWVTGPEAGTIFWRGQVNGTTPKFAFWNNNEPNDFRGNDPVGEDYAHITDPSIGIQGAWNDLPNQGGIDLYIAKGYVVEYGIPGDPPLNIVASTSIYIPSITDSKGAEICETGTTTISATPSEGDILWFDTQTGGTQLAIGNSFTTPNLTSTTTYFATVSVNGCNTLERIPVTVVVNPRPTITSKTNDLICSGTANLTAKSSEGQIYWYDSLSSTTPIFIGDSFETPNLNTTTSYFVEANNNNCISSTRTKITAVVDNTIPSFDILNNVVLCTDVGSIDLEIINFQDNYRYIWMKDGNPLISDLGIISVNSSGTYTVKAVSNAGCESAEQTIIISDSEKATITKDDVIITDDSDNNSIQVTSSNLGSGTYQFAIDDEFRSYKDDGFFENLSTGIHTLFIKDNGGCGTEKYVFSILSYANFFTPNQDGTNDFWKISGYDKTFYTSSEISIYNRFGNLIYQFDENSEGWDGNYQGKKLPNNTYWFRVSLTDINGTTIEKTGNFSLIR